MKWAVYISHCERLTAFGVDQSPPTIAVGCPESVVYQRFDAGMDAPALLLRAAALFLNPFGALEDPFARGVRRG